MRAVLPFSVTLLCACASGQPDTPITMSTQGMTMVRSAAVIDVRDVTVRDGQASGIGAFVGALLGGIAGSKIGSGNGNAAATIGGALAGGMAGQHLEQSGASRHSTVVTVRFENGDERSYSVEPDDNFRIGETVKVTTSPGSTRVSR